MEKGWFSVPAQPSSLYLQTKIKLKYNSWPMKGDDRAHFLYVCKAVTTAKK